MTAMLKNLRHRVWPPEQASVGEALRDLHSFCERLTLCSVVTATGAVWSEPFSISVERRPSIVLLGDARLAGTLEAAETGALDWQFDVQQSGRVRIRINRAATLQPGTSYDLRFLVVY